MPDRNDTPSPVPLVYIARGGAIDGSGRQLLYLLAHLDRSRFRPLVVLDEGGPLSEQIQQAGVSVVVTAMHPWRSLRGLPWRKRDARRITSIARHHESRLVHCSDTWRTPYARFVAHALDVPLVSHVRGPTTPRDLKKNHCVGAAAIIGIAERYRAEILAAGQPVDRTHIIDDAVDCQTYFRKEPVRAMTRRALEVADTVVIGLVGRIEPAKRVDAFIDVLACLPHDLNMAALLIGSTRRDDYVDAVREKVASAGLNDRVHFMGRRDDMPAVLSALDLLVTMSGGSVMFEAMACGVPVLSVRPDGRHSQYTVHEQTAWCVTTDAPQPAAEALERLIRDTALRQRLAEAGRACVTERLNPRRMADWTQAIYDMVLSETR
jgi:glycosyltransferase involved in cell wall biosynthesis